MYNKIDAIIKAKIDNQLSHLPIETDTAAKEN
jgi:hypothetical protein